MIYKIIVDKQPLTNPSNEKKEYQIDIEELRYKGDIYDSLVITIDEDYVMRRLELSEYGVLSVLENPIKQPLNDINIELFEGDNYIYLYDMLGNKIVAEYLVKNEFNEIYVTKSEMNSSISQTANAIELSVNAKFEDVDGNISDITGELSLKVDKNDNDQIVSMINASADEITLTSNRLIIDSTNFKLNDEGNITATGGNIADFNITNQSLQRSIDGIYDFDTYDLSTILNIAVQNLDENTLFTNIYDLNNTGSVDAGDARAVINIINGTTTNTKRVTGNIKINSNNPKNCIEIENGSTKVLSLGVNGLDTFNVATKNLTCGSQVGTLSSGLKFVGITMNGGSSNPMFRFSGNTTSTRIDDNGIATQGDIEATDIIESYTKLQAPIIQITGAGYCMNGTATNYTYKCNWDGSALHFYVDNTDIGNISDKRLKTDIKEVDEDLIKAIGELDYKQFKKDNRNGLISVGVIAQDLIEVLKKYNKNAKDYELLQEFEYNLDEKTLYYKIDYEQFLLLRMMAKEIEIKELQEKDKQKDELIKDLISRVENLEKGEK